MHLWSLNIFNQRIRTFCDTRSNSCLTTFGGMGQTNSLPDSSNWYSDPDLQNLNDETGICQNVVSGTSNNNFLQYRYLKKVYHD